MLFTNYIKASQVTDFARSTSRHNTQAMPLYELLKLRIIYISLNYTELAKYFNQSTNSSRSNRPKTTNQAKLAKAEIYGSLAVALLLLAIYGGVV